MLTATQSLDDTTLSLFEHKGRENAVKVRRVLQAFTDLTGRPFHELRVLDTGCGEGIYAIEPGCCVLEDAVRKMTSLNAAKVGLTDRGLLRPGQYADITVFDPKTVIDRSAYSEPFQYSTGIRHVLVNGQPVLENGEHTGALPGRALRRTGRSN